MTIAQLPVDPARLDIENITVTYNGKPILQQLSFAVPHGSTVAVVGPNGAGKSTLFKALVGLLPVQSGNIYIHGMPLGQHKDCVAYVPQREEIDWRFPITVKEVVMMGRFNRIGWFRKARLTDHRIVQTAMDQMGIRDLASNSISDLSGGQQQRVFLARAIAQEPHILLMDEPFTGIDVTTQETTLQLLQQLRRHNVTVMVSTHDLSMAANHFDLILLINRRLIAYGTPGQVLTTHHLRQSFGDKLLVLDGTALIDECCPPGEDRYA